MLYFKRNSFVAFFIYLIILCPAFFGYFTLNKGQMIYLAVIFFCTLIFFLFDVSNLLRSFSRNHTYFILGFLLLCCEYFASSVLNIRRNSYSFGDFIEVLRPVVYLFTYLTSLVIIIPTLRKKGICFVFNIFEKAVFFFSLIEFLKFFKPSFPFFALYSLFPFGSINFVRMSGTTGFAYSWAWIICVCLFWNIFLNRKITLKFVYYSFLILLTGSRTGFLTLLITYFFVFLFFKKTRGILVLALIMLSSLLVVLYFLEVEVVKTSIDYIIRLIMTVLGKASDGSFSTRRNQNQLAMQYFDENMFFGIASNKAQNITIENFYFHHLRNWGLLGISIYVITLFGFLIFSRRKYRKISLVILISAFVISFSSPVFDQIRNFNIMYLLFAVLLEDKTDFFSQTDSESPKKKNIIFLQYLFKMKTQNTEALSCFQS